MIKDMKLFEVSLLQNHDNVYEAHLICGDRQDAAAIVDMIEDRASYGIEFVQKEMRPTLQWQGEEKGFTIRRDLYLRVRMPNPDMDTAKYLEKYATTLLNLIS